MAIDLTVFNNAFLAPFGESVNYLPRGSSTPRPITANVQREGIQLIEGTESATAPAFTLHAKNDATTGISGTELDTGGDAIQLPDVSGGTNVTRRVRRLVDSDPGMLVLLVQ